MFEHKTSATSFRCETSNKSIRKLEIENKQYVVIF